MEKTVKTLSNYGEQFGKQDAIGLQFGSTVNVINLSTKTFDRDVFKLLSKNLNFVPKQKYFNKTKVFNEMNGFYRRIKLKAHFKDHANKPKAEEVMFRKQTDKTWMPKRYPSYY